MADKNTYLEAYEKIEPELARAAPEWLTSIRKTAKQHFATQGFPTHKNEAWRFTRVRPLLGHQFELQTSYRQNGLGAAELGDLSFADEGCTRLVFVNGNFAANLSTPHDRPQGVRIDSLQRAVESDGDVIESHLGRHADASTNPFVALNTAHLIDGAFVHVPKGTVVDAPIHLVFVSTSDGSEPVSYPRNLIIIGDNAQATIIESFAGAGETSYFTNTVTEMVVGRGAHVDHYKLQKEDHRAYHTGSLDVHLGSDCHFETNFISLGGALVRNDVNAYLGGEGIHCQLDGLYLADGYQHVDNNTNLEHAEPNCNSYELYKGVLSGRANGVFNGKIHVHPDAQKTDAKQSNGCMLLSDDAQINTNPQLEIYADDVKCTHGAVVGQLEENTIFYLRSRGISAVDARHMLIYAFANEVVDRVRVDALRDRVESDVRDWLRTAQHIDKS